MNTSELKARLREVGDAVNDGLYVNRKGDILGPSRKDMLMAADLLDILEAKLRLLRMLGDEVASLCDEITWDTPMEEEHAEVTLMNWEAARG